MDKKLLEIISKITILIPVYNSRENIKRSLKNIIGKFNIILVDDGSESETKEILKRIKKNYDNVLNKSTKSFEIYTNEENYGVAKTRNILIDKVKTKFFTFLDAGDVLNIDELYKLLNEFLKYYYNNKGNAEENVSEKSNENKIENYDILSFGFVEINENLYMENDKKTYINTSEYKMDFIGKGKEFFTEMVLNKKSFDMPCGLIYNTSFFKKNNFKYLEGYVHEDFGLTPYIILKANKVYSKNVPVYIYIRESVSITKGKDPEETYKNALDILENAIRLEDMVKKMYEEGKIDKNTYYIFKSYLANTLINKIDNLEGVWKKKYINFLNNKNIEKYYLNNFKGFIKKIIYILKYKLI